jgi:hypothetical protein
MASSTHQQNDEPQEPARDTNETASELNRIQIAYDPRNAISAHSVAATAVLCALARHARFGREDVDKRFRPGFPGFEVVRA